MKVCNDDQPEEWPGFLESLGFRVQGCYPKGPSKYPIVGYLASGEYFAWYSFWISI